MSIDHLAPEPIEIRLVTRIPKNKERCTISGLSRSEICALISGPSPKVGSMMIPGVNSKRTGKRPRGNRLVLVEPLLTHLLETGSFFGDAEQRLRSYLEGLRSAFGLGTPQTETFAVHTPNDTLSAPEEELAAPDANKPAVWLAQQEFPLPGNAQPVPPQGNIIRFVPHVTEDELLHGKSGYLPEERAL